MPPAFDRLVSKRAKSQLPPHVRQEQSAGASGATYQAQQARNAAAEARVRKALGKMERSDSLPPSAIRPKHKNRRTMPNTPANRVPIYPGG